MTEARGDLRRRIGALCALAAGSAVALNPGCACADGETGQRTPDTGETDAAAGATTGAGGSGAADGGGGGSAAGAQPYRITPLARALAFDATPDPQAGLVYFTSVDASGRPGVFKVGARNGARIAPVAAGAPFVAPLGIATGTSGARLYVTDPGAGDPSGTDGGQIFSVDPTSGAVLPVSGGEGMLPRGVEVLRDAAGADQIVFSGIDTADGQPGVFKLPARGGQASALLKGSPLVDPSGVAVTDAGEVFVCDPLSSPDKTATIFKIEDGFASPLVTGLRAGYPCGLALTRDAGTLFVLTRSTAASRDEVTAITLSSGAVTALPTGAGDHDEPGGLHRAKGADVFAFVDGKAQETGAVSLLDQ
jgi:hypothetical protein